MLEVKNIRKIYHVKKSQPVTALEDIHITFPEKGMVFLLGKSGSGKSTLLHILGGLDQCDEGELIICGKSSKSFGQKEYDAYRNTYVGFVFQDYNILEDYSVGVNIALAIQLQGRQPSTEEIHNTLIQVDMEGMEERRPNELSGGQRQRVAIARALVKQPQIILADEPTGALDSVTGYQVLDTLKKLSEDKLVIVVSHDRDFAEKYADRIIELSDGKIIRDTVLDEKEEKTVSIPSENTKDWTPAAPSESNTFSPIYSRLPLKTAFGIGLKGLRRKKLRLILVILLSAVSFSLFGFVDAVSSFDRNRVCADSLYDYNIENASVSMKKYREDMDDHIDYPLSQRQMEKLEAQTGMRLTGVYEETNGMGFQDNLNTSALPPLSEYSLQIPTLSGFAEVDETVLKQHGYSLAAGRLPDGQKKEVAVSRYVYELFQTAGYTECPENPETYDREVTYAAVSSPEDLVGKTILLNGNNYTITGIVDTRFAMERYQQLQTVRTEKSTLEKIINGWLYEEFLDNFQTDLASVAMVGRGFVEQRQKENQNPYVVLGAQVSAQLISPKYSHECSYLTTLDEADQNRILWMKEPKSSLGEKEVILVFRENDPIRYARTEEENAVDETIYKEDGTVDYLETFRDTTFQMKVKEERGSITILRMEEDGYTVAGVLLLPEGPNDPFVNCRVTNLICGDSLFKRLCGTERAVYMRAFARLPDGKKEISSLIRYCYGKNQDQFPLRTMVTFELDILREPMEDFARGFLKVAQVTALFAMILLANYITLNISYRQHEIGILRAIGARSRDVFAIFCWEGVFIAFLSFLAASALAAAGSSAVNALLRSKGLYVTVLHFGIRQVVLILFVSLLAALLACALPVTWISEKRPVDAIRER